MKKVIRKIVLSLFMFFCTFVVVNADSLYDNLQSGDIIIGNTTFRSGTWVSTTRASKAGALFNQNTGSTNLKTYFYVNKNLWYELNDATDEYRMLSSSEISEIENNLQIFYENNNGLSKTYLKNSDDGAGLILDYATNNDGVDFKLDDANVKIDKVNETVSCPIDYEFSFNVAFKYGENPNTRETYYGKCGINGLSVIAETEKKSTPLNIISVELATDEEFVNQNKVNFNGNFYEITNSLGEFEVDGRKGKYIVFDVTLDENNLRPSVYGNNYSNTNVMMKFLSNNKIRFFIDTDTYNTYSGNFVLIDGFYNKYESLSIYIRGKEKSNYNLSISEIKPSELNIKNNNQSKIKELKTIVNDNYQSKQYHYYTIGTMNVYSINDSSIAEWIATDVIFNEGVDYDALNVNISGDDNSYYYEKLSDRLRIYISNGNNNNKYNYISVSITDLSTNGNNRVYFGLSMSNYKDYNYVDYAEENNKLVEFDTSDINNISLVTIPSNYSSYYEIYFDETNKKLYYYDSIYENWPLIKNSNGIYELTRNQEGQIVLSNVFAIGVRDNNNLSIINETESILDDSSMESLETYIGEDDIKIYYFFNRDMTTKEENFINNLKTLSETKTNLTVTDISTNIYNES